MRGAAAFGLVAVAVVAIGWLQSPPDITGAEAVSAARGAFRAAGVDGARVDPHPRAGTYRPADDGAPLAVWRTSTRVRGGAVALWLAREDGEPVFLDDRSGDGATQLLSDSEFQALAAHFENPAAGRQIRRNLVLTLAAGLVVASAVHWDLQRRRVRLGGTAPASLAPPSSPPSPSAPSVRPVATPPAGGARRPRRSAPLRAASGRDRPLRAQEIL